MRKLYIPQNFNVSDYSFFEIRHAQKYYFLLSTLYLRRIINKKEKSEAVRLSYKLLEKYLTPKKAGKIITDLLKAHIIKVESQYSTTSHKSKSYKLTKPFRMQKFRAIPLTDPIIANKLDAEKQKILNDNLLSKLYESLSKVEIDFEAALEFISQKDFGSNQFNSYLLSIELIKDKNFFFLRDSTSHRIHSNVSNLLADLRKFLRLNGSPLIELDLSNSQPFLFNLLIYNYRVIEKLFKLPYVLTNKDNIIPFVDAKFPDIALYRKLTQEGSLYDFLMEKFNSSLTRGEFKRYFFKRVFYSRESSKNWERRKFNELFPNVGAIIRYYKREDYRNLAITLQKVESEIMIDVIANRLVNEGIFVLTVHDSIITTPSNAEYVKAIIKDEFGKRHKFTPTVTTKRR